MNRALEKAELPGAAAHGGRKDLRGLVVSVIVRRRRLESIDFSFSIWKLPAQFIFSEVRDSLFDQAEVGASLDHAFCRCSFKKAKLARVVLRGVFESCDFAGANLRDAGASDVRFAGCSFAGANLTRAHFLRCSFVDCDFSHAYFGEGSLAGSTIEGSVVDKESLRSTLLERVTWKDPR